MYVLGHVATSRGAAQVAQADLAAGERVLELMLPDLLSCHDWAYDRSWYRSETTRDRLVVAHMTGDAVIHYGRSWTGERRRCGWAYLRMGQVARRYDEFWRDATECGWRLPDRTDRDSRRGWAHTLVEYSIDQMLADRQDWSALLAAVRDQAERTLRSRRWVDDFVQEATVVPSKPVASQPERYCRAVARARQPDEIHLRGLAVKFGLVETDEALDWLRGWTRGIVDSLGEAEIRAVVAEVAEVVADPAAAGYPVRLGDAAGIPDPARAFDTRPVAAGSRPPRRRHP